MASVEFNAVDKYYAGKPILENINFAINKGEFIVIVGPSGCGKSTLLRLVAGLEETSKGSILINNKMVNNIPPALRDMAMVFQNYALYPHMTVYNNIAYNLKIRRLKKNEIKERVHKVAKLLKLTDYLNYKPDQLSGGQKQRVAMGRALIRSPSVFLFDEPLSNLDTNLRNEMRWEIKKLHQEFRTTSLYVTHDQTEAMTLADRIVILNNGKIEQIDTPERIYSHPATLFVANFIGQYAINFIPAIVDLNNKRLNSELGLKLPLELNSTVANNQSILIAIRPEHLYIDNNQSPTSNNFLVKVEFVENLGSDKILHVRSEIGNFPLKLRINESHNIVGDKLKLTINLEKIMLFCKTTGKSIHVK